MNQWVIESMDQWSDEAMTQKNKQPVNLEPTNRWINEPMKRRSNDSEK